MNRIFRATLTTFLLAGALLAATAQDNPFSNYRWTMIDATGEVTGLSLSCGYTEG